MLGGKTPHIQNVAVGGVSNPIALNSQSVRSLERLLAVKEAIDELQATMIVLPSEALYLPKFTYLWTLGVGRFPDALRKRVSRDSALREIARSFLTSAGMTARGELARVTGLSRVEAGRGNRALVAEGYAKMHAPGVYELIRRGAVPPGNDDAYASTTAPDEVDAFA